MRHNPEKTLGKILDSEETARAVSANVTNVAYHAKVVDIDDPENSKRIKVRIVGVDDGTEDKDLPWCVSLMPNFFYCLPQVDEHVVIFMMAPWNKSYTRLYSGPLQTGNFGEQIYDETMTAFGFIVDQNGG